MQIQRNGSGSFYFTAQAFIKVIWHDSVYKANAYIYNPKTLSICKCEFHHLTHGMRLYKKIHWHFEWWTDAEYTTGFYWLRCLRRQFWSMTSTTLWLIKLYFFCHFFFFFFLNPSGFIPMHKTYKVTQVSYEASCPAVSQMHADQPFKWPLDFAP